MEKFRKVLQSDPMIRCFFAVAKLYDHPVTLEELIPHLPKTNAPISPCNLIEAISNLGFKGQLEKSKPNQLKDLIPGTILFLKNRKACVFIEYGDNTQSMFVRELDNQSERIEINFGELQNIYDGYCLKITVPSVIEEKRANESKIFSFKKSWFWSVFFQYKSFYVHMLLAALFVNVFALAMPLFMMNVYDRVVPNNALVTLWTLAIGLGCVLIFDFILKVLRSLFADVANKKLDIIISSKLFHKALAINMEHQPSSTGVRANHLKDFDCIRDFFSSVTLTGLIDLPFLFIFLAVIGIIGGPVFIVPVVFGLVSVISALILSIPIYRYIQKTFVGGAQKTAILFESLSAIELIKTSLAYQKMLVRWRGLTAAVAKSSMRSKLYSNLATNITALCTILSNVAVVIWGVYLINAGDMTTGGLIACVILSGRALAPFGQITSLLTRYQQTKCSYKELDKLMHTPDEVDSTYQYLPREKLDGAIEFQQLSFRYPGTEVDFLKNISLSIEPGEHVAILGNAGSGKTTLHKLIMGLYAPTAGQVNLDHVNQLQIDPELVRQEIGYLEQAPKLLFGNAVYNITLKSPWAKSKDVIAAAKISGADKFIHHHPQGYQMQIGEGGKGLSGGQIQMLALARAVLLNPKILLLDEPTSSMDSMSEQHIITQLKQFSKNKTLIMNTHKHSMLELVDRIIVLHKGCLVFDGNKADALAFLTQKGGQL